MKRVYAHIILLAALLLVVPTAHAAVSLPAGFSRLETCPFVVCSEWNDTAVLRLSESDFNEMATGIIFRVNRTDVQRNQPFFHQFNDSVIRRLAREGYRIEHIYIRGAASPEGPYANNRYLGMTRTAELYRLLSERLGESMDQLPPMDRTSVIEDYHRLVDMMEAANDSDAQYVRDLMTRCHWNEYLCKKVLMSVRHGELWERLKQDYFPDLRAARVVLWVKRTPAKVETIGGAIAPAAPIAATTIFTSPTGSTGLTSPTSLTGDTGSTTPSPLGGESERGLNRREMLSIKTNLLFDFAYVPKYGMAWILNGQVEYYPKHGHITPVISFDGPWWTNRSAEHKYFQVRNYQAEARWYFRKEDARYDGWYAGIYGHGMLYGIGFNGGEGYQGEGWGVGLSGGYVLPLIKGYRHLKLEFGIQVGYFRTHYDPYIYGCPVEQVEDGLYYYNWTGKKQDFVERQWLWQWFGPTRIGITLTYDLLYRKHSDKSRPMDDDYNKAIKGASFIWHE